MYRSSKVLQGTPLIWMDHRIGEPAVVPSVVHSTIGDDDVRRKRKPVSNQLQKFLIRRITSNSSVYDSSRLPLLYKQLRELLGPAMVEFYPVGSGTTKCENNWAL